MAGASQHPTDQTLSSDGLGTLDDVAASVVGQRVGECPDCRQRVAEMSADGFLARVRAAKAGAAATSALVHPGRTRSFRGNDPTSPPPAATLPPGLADHPDYSIRRELGRGGMGVVYLAHNTLMGRDEVLKVIGRQVIERPGVLDRFQREIRAVAKLRHPNIVAADSAPGLGGGSPAVAPVRPPEDAPDHPAGSPRPIAAQPNCDTLIEFEPPEVAIAVAPLVRSGRRPYLHRMAFGRANVLATHPSSETDPELIDFSGLTANRGGTLAPWLHAFPTRDGSRVVVVVDGKPARELTVNDAEGWVRVEVPFDHKEV